jgi:hypothetical protein
LLQIGGPDREFHLFVSMSRIGPAKRMLRPDDRFPRDAPAIIPWFSLARSILRAGRFAKPVTGA